MIKSRNCQLIKKMIPVYKDYIWGGENIKTRLGKNSPYACTAESWEVSTHKDGLSLLEDGTTFKSFIESQGIDVLGNNYKKDERFPVLIKYIDAKNNLSIQVHPGDEYARIHENDNGKNEMWYIVSTDPGAFIYLGFNKDTTREEVEKRIKENTLEEILNKVEVKEGESYFIKAGTIHAIGAGCLIAEIQQTSNVTYRLYDYGRLGKNGKPRELHIQKGLDVLNYKKQEMETHSGYGVLAICPSFKVRKHELWRSHKIKGTAESFIIAMIVKGEGTINKEKTKIGDTWFISSTQDIKLMGNMTVLTVTI